jgi:hypothetical protein
VENLSVALRYWRPITRKHGLGVGVVSVLLTLTAPVARAADDKAECNAGIERIKAEIAKKPAKRVLDRLQKALKAAEQEVGESDWDECVAAIREGKKALPKK